MVLIRRTAMARQYFTAGLVDEMEIKLVPTRTAKGKDMVADGVHMPESTRMMADWSSAVLEVISIGIITSIAIYALFYALFLVVKKEEPANIFRRTRHTLGRGILLGLEFLIAADIIRTVAAELTFEALGSLAIIILIRTFLSFSLDVELTGAWPWQDKK